MIKELLLSIALSAAYGVSFVGSPKKAVSNTYDFNGSYDFSVSYTGEASISSPKGDGDGIYTPDELTLIFSDYPAQERPNLQFWASASRAEIRFYFDNNEEANKFGDYPASWTRYAKNAVLHNCAFDDAYIEEDEEGYYAIWNFAFDEELTGQNQGYATCSFVIQDPDTQYTLTKSFVNCDIASSPVLPSTYTAETAPMKPSYYVLMVSNAGGYGFTSESVTQTGGITIRNFNLIDQYNNSGYYATCSFNVDLPFNDCSIRIEAFLPTYTITTKLERCTVSPAIPSSYAGTSFYGDYTFTANNGYGFNKNYTHWEVSNLFIDKVEFSNLLWGSFYSSVTLRLRASGGNSSISVTAIEYDEENYKLGYEEGKKDGWQAGYDKGHADGEIAGDSYGVWNWLKQAARTTGEFLNINLLPGFSIGALLTALAGLMIIWLFIKGFLFKS